MRGKRIKISPVDDYMGQNRFNLSILIKEIIDKVKNEKIEAEITMNPEELNLKFNPWEPFRYNCPYQNSEEN